MNENAGRIFRLPWMVLTFSLLGSLLVGCPKPPSVTVAGGALEGDPYAEAGAALAAGSTITVTGVTGVADEVGEEGSTRVVMRAPGGHGITFDCVCKSGIPGQGDLNCTEKCEIDLGSGTAECRCDAAGCNNCAANLGLSSRSIGLVASRG
jgi:hypothetical protein